MFYDELDARLLGGTQWGWTDDYNDRTRDGWNNENFSIVDARRNLRSNFAVRPYPKAIAGIPGQFKVCSAAHFLYDYCSSVTSKEVSRRSGGVLDICARLTEAAFHC